jgi:hypothetical protein
MISNGVDIFQPVDSVSSKNEDEIYCRLERFQIGSTQMQTTSNCVTVVASSLDIRKTGPILKRRKIIAQYITSETQFSFKLAKFYGNHF